jgi:drug/metabolite transporter (DMT)-like permease
MTPLYLAAFRFALAAAVHFLFLHRKIGRISREDLKMGVQLGVLLFIAFTAQTVGLQYTTASKQGFLTATYVVMVPGISWLYYKKMPLRKDFIAGGVTLLGIGLIGLDGRFSLNIGDLLTLICAVFFAAHILATATFSKMMNVFKLSFLQIATAAVLFSIFAMILEPMPQTMAVPELRAIIYLGVFSTFLCFTIQTVAQKYTSASHASILLSLESLFAALFGIMLLNETLTPKIFIGCVLIFAAVLIVEVEFKKRA